MRLPPLLVLAVLGAARPAASEPASELPQAVGLSRAEAFAFRQAASAPLPKAAPRPMPIPAGSALSMVREQELLPGIYHLNFPTQHLLTSTFLRFQEYYESPRFRGKVFTLEEFMDWYAQAQGKKGNFTYFTDWSGFNIPSKVFAPFRAGKFDPLTTKEAALVELFRGVPEPFYVIGTFGKNGDPATLHHEIAHGLYTTQPGYRARVDAILKTADLRPLFERLRKMGYDDSVVPDEAQAYLNESDPDKDLLGPEHKRYDGVRKLLRAAFRDYAPGY